MAILIARNQNWNKNAASAGMLATVTMEIQLLTICIWSN